MESFILAGADKPVFMPEVHLDAHTGHCRIKGESYLEEPFELYDSILTWIRSCADAQAVMLDVELTYINSTSSRAILDLFRGLRELKQGGASIEVNWRYPQGNEDFNEIKEEGEEFIDESGLEMNLIAY
jgi:hypothetical protein